MKNNKINKKILSLSMLLLFSILTFTNHSSAAIESIAIIRPDCANKSISTANCYTSLSLWEAGEQKDLVATDQIAIARIEGIWTAPDTTALTIDGWTTGPNNYIKIYTAPEARHAGKWEDNKYRLEVIASSWPIEAVNIKEEYVRIDGLQIKLTGGNTSYNIAVDARGITSSANDLRISNNIIQGVLTIGQNGAHGIILRPYGGVGNTAKIWNNIVYGFTDGDSGIGINLGENANTTAYVYNNTVYGCYQGFYVYSYPYIAIKNNIANGNNIDYQVNTSPEIYLNNISQDNSSPNASFRNKTVAFADSANKDFHLASSDISAINQGVDLSSDTNLAFTTGISGNPRSAPWDIGADEYTGTYTPPPAPAPDTTSPTISNTTSSNITNNSATLTWTTDEASTSQIEYGITNAYGSETIENTNLTTSHSVSLSSLNTDTTYHYRVKSKDSSNNPAVSNDYTFTTLQTSSDTTAPITTVSPTGGTYTSSQTITLTANEASTIYYTTNGTNPTTASNTYSTPITISQTTTLKFFAKDTAGNQETIKTENYTINSAPVSGGTYYVATNGLDTNNGSIASPWLHIEYGMKQLKPGDTLYLRGGTHNSALGGYLDVWSSAGDDGAPGAYKTVKAYPGETPVIKMSKAMFISANYWRIEGLTFDSTSIIVANEQIRYGYSNWGLLKSIIDDSPHHVQFVGNTFAGIFDSAAIQTTASDVLIENNDLSNISSSVAHPKGTALYICSGINLTVRGNIIQGQGAYGIQVFDQRRAGTETYERLIKNVVIENNVIYKTSGKTSRGIIISAQDGTGQYDHTTGENAIIRNNIIYDVDTAGMLIDSGWNGIKVYNNQIYNPNSPAIVFRKISATWSNNVEIKNNILDLGNNYSSQYHIDFQSTAGTNITVNNNLYYPTPVKFTGGAFIDANKMEADPNFVNPVSHDFHLKSTSPAINAGLTLAEVVKDKDGIARPQSSAYDIGAYEYAGTYTPPPLTPAPDTTPPTISTPTTSVTTSSATITFTTNENTNSHIQHGLTSSYSSNTQTTNNSTNFSFTLSNLSDNTTYNYRIVSTDLANNTSQSINYTFKTNQAIIPDTTPPASITNLSASSITQTSAKLSWTSPGDDGNTGIASSYNIRYSTSPITDLNWTLATEVSGEPTPSSSGTEDYVSIGLSPDTTYYFAIKASDEVPNISILSNIISFKTLANIPTTPQTPATPSTPSAPSTPAAPSAPSAPSAPASPGTPANTFTDTTPPREPLSFSAKGADKQISLSWINPKDTDFVRIKILRTEGQDDIDPTCPISPVDPNAKTIYEGDKQEYTDINLDNTKKYCYAIFAYDQTPNYSTLSTKKAKPNQEKTSISTPPSTTSTTIYNLGTVTLRKGSTGEPVKELQKLLNKILNLGLVIDGKLGSKTIAVIMQWQKEHGLVPDGLVGNKTKAKMISEGTSSTPLPTTPTTTYNLGTVTLRKGSTGEPVKELQKLLNKILNLGLVIDGKLGPKTITVIKKWQSDHNLVADGLVGKKTKEAMIAEGE